MGARPPCESGRGDGVDGADYLWLGEFDTMLLCMEAADDSSTLSGPSPLGRLSALSVSHSKSIFVWRFCMGAQGLTTQTRWFPAGQEGKRLQVLPDRDLLRLAGPGRHQGGG
jgi:hypothetical protein